MSEISYRDTPDGTTLLVRRWSAADPIGASVVLVHGLNEHSGRYEHVGRHFTTAGYDVVGYDHRSFGRSGGRARSHVDVFDQFVDDLAAVLADERDGDRPVAVVAHSMGALISAALAVSERPQPDTFVLSAPPLGVDVPRWQRLMSKGLTSIAPRMSIPGKIDSTTLSRDVEVQRAYDEDPLVQRDVTVRLGAEMFAAMDATAAAVGNITVPTLVLHGAEDRLVHPRHSAVLGGVPAVRREILPDLRHEIFNEPEQAEVLDRVVAWLGATLDL